MINDQKHQPSLNCLKYNLIGYCLNNPAACQASEDERDLDKALGIYNMQAFLRHARKLLDGSDRRRPPLILPRLTILVLSVRPLYKPLYPWKQASVLSYNSAGL